MLTRTMLIVSIVCVAAAGSVAADPAPMSIRSYEEAQKLLDGGLKYLLGRQNPGGGWSMEKGAFEPAITALVLKALVQSPAYSIESEPVRKGLARLVSFQQDNGAIANSKEGYENYQTSIAVCALAAANDPRYKDQLANAVKYLRGIQIQPNSKAPDGREIGKDHPYIGGVSYNTHGRPDLNNVGWWMEAMHAAKVPADDPAMQAALAFVTRTQNQSETNKMAWAQDGTDDGGFIYAPAQRDVTVPESKADESSDGTSAPRSYGSISYVGWKSLLYAGVDKKDPRVKGVIGWVRRNWTWEVNPNFPKARGEQGLYFYYLALARALNAWGIDTITEAGTSTPHRWRNELVTALAKRVHEDGSWANVDAPRWSEGSPILTTAYCCLALEEAIPGEKPAAVNDE